MRGTLNDLRVSIQRKLQEFEDEAAGLQLTLFEDDADGYERLRVDMDALRERFARIDDDIDREVGNLQRRYEVRDIHWFPVAAEILVPSRQA